MLEKKAKPSRKWGKLRGTPRSKLNTGTCHDTLPGGGRGGTIGWAEPARRLEKTATSESNGTGIRALSPRDGRQRWKVQVLVGLWSALSAGFRVHA